MTNKIIEEGYKPMAAPEITIQDRIDALEAKCMALEKRIERHEQYHFGKQGR
jgi:hypothetical protein